MRKVIFSIFVSLVILCVMYGSFLVLYFEDMLEGLYSCFYLEEFQKFYAKELRGHLFAAFLALGGFLLSLKTFIIVTMKTNVYDSKGYRKEWESLNKLNPKLSLYGPLKELSDLLYYAIFATILAAVIQMTIGLYPSFITALLSVLSCIVAIVLLVDSLLVIKRNLDTWFKHIDNGVIESSE